MANLSATTKIEILMITTCWTEFHIKIILRKNCMAKVFRPSHRESTILSNIESSKEFERKKIIKKAKENIETLSNAIAMKLIEKNLIETTNKNEIENQILLCLKDLIRSEDFDVDYKIAPFKNIVSNPNIVSVYVAVFVVEDLINHKDIIDIYGADDEIYYCINKQVVKHLK